MTQQVKMFVFVSDLDYANFSFYKVNLKHTI